MEWIIDLAQRHQCRCDEEDGIDLFASIYDNWFNQNFTAKTVFVRLLALVVLIVRRQPSLIDDDDDVWLEEVIW